MEYRFKASEWLNLSPGERAKRCLIMAHEASELALAAETRETKRMYLQLAEDWQKLAQVIQQESPTGIGPPRGSH